MTYSWSHLSAPCFIIFIEADLAIASADVHTLLETVSEHTLAATTS
jgi:hypothetical protein